MAVDLWVSVAVSTGASRSIKRLRGVCSSRAMHRWGLNQNGAVRTRQSWPLTNLESEACIRSAQPTSGDSLKTNAASHEVRVGKRVPG